MTKKKKRVREDRETLIINKMKAKKMNYDILQLFFIQWISLINNKQWVTVL